MQLTSAPARRSPTSDAVRLDRWTVAADGVAPREVMVPSAAVVLGWAGWDESAWERVWTWATVAELDDVPLHAELEVDAVLGRIEVGVNGHRVGAAESGFLPCVFDVASALRPGANRIELVEDARWRRVPPMGSPLGASDVDFFLPAGIQRPVRLRLGDAATRARWLATGARGVSTGWYASLSDRIRIGSGFGPPRHSQVVFVRHDHPPRELAPYRVLCSNTRMMSAAT